MAWRSLHGSLCLSWSNLATNKRRSLLSPFLFDGLEQRPSCSSSLLAQRQLAENAASTKIRYSTRPRHLDASPAWSKEKRSVNGISRGAMRGAGQLTFERFSTGNDAFGIVVAIESIVKRPLGHQKHMRQPTRPQLSSRWTTILCLDPVTHFSLPL